MVHNMNDYYEIEVPDEIELGEIELNEHPIQIGTVFGCVKLNVRETPNMEASIIGTVKAGSEVMVDPDRSTNDFYKVTLASGIEGYCIKQYISIDE